MCVHETWNRLCTEEAEWSLTTNSDVERAILRQKSLTFALRSFCLSVPSACHTNGSWHYSCKRCQPWNVTDTGLLGRGMSRMDDTSRPSSILGIHWPGISYMPDPDPDTYIYLLNLWLMFDSGRLRQDTHKKKIKAMRSIGFRQSIEHRPCGYFQFFSLPTSLGLWCSLQRSHVPVPGTQCVCSFRDHSSIDFFMPCLYF